MSLIINHNLMAMNAARNLGATYGKLSNSVQRLSSGLRINSSADDAAGLAIREMMRADIVTTQQGLRNAADAISLIQTADGALGVIDEKLIRMKELAEQAATGTYTTAQRDIINSEYQAMAKEIDRIANATNFNGVKLLDGSITNQHGGQGLKIHFGVSNDAAEDYYFVNIGDARATSKTGLRVGGDAKNDIWGQGAAGAGPMAGPGCCTAGFTSLEGAAGFTSGQTFSYGYNWDWTEDSDAELLSGKYLAGRYTVAAGDSLQDLVDKVNLGTQSRVGVGLDAAGAAAIEAGGTLAICLGDEAYYWGSATAAQGGTVTEQIHEFAYKYDTGLVKAGDIVASGALRTLLQGATGVNVEAAIRNAPSSAAAVAALNTKVAEALNGRQMLSAVTTTWGGASAASVALAQSFLHITTQNGTLTKDPTTLFSADTTASAGTAFTDTDFGRLGIIQGATNGNNIGTQIYTDGGSNWTTSATLATDLGWAEKKITINTYDSSATIVTKLNNAWNGLTRSADGTVTT
ncbi:hypothetical protein FACS189460_1770 [Deltaproteobacteria bacterium]|nr:hypothetical protein FACS189460_1770 [Deltaproteobacteria bacterium]